MHSKVKTSFFSYSAVGKLVYLGSIVTDCVLPLAGRDHPAYIARGTASW